MSMNVGRNQADIIIKVAMQMMESSKKLTADAKTAAKKVGTNYSKQLQSAYNKAQGQSSALKAKRFELKNLLLPEQYAQVQKTYTGLGRTVQGKLLTPLKRLELANKKVSTSMARTAKNGKIAFAGWAMSIMFFGMALQKMFNGVWKQSSKTFQDVMHSVENTVTSFDMLNGGLTYLKFNIGQALEPIATMLLPIIDRWSEWIGNNQELTRSIVKNGIVFGGLFAVGGSGFLALNGFTELGVKMGLIPMKMTSAGNSVIDFGNTAGGVFKTLGKAATIAVSMYFIKETIEDIAAGDWVGAVANAMIAAGAFFITKVPYLGGYLLAIGLTMKFIETGAADKFISWFQEKIITLGELWDDFVSSVKAFGLSGLGKQRDKMQSIYKYGTPGLTSVYTPPTSTVNYNTYVIGETKIEAASLDDALTQYNQRVKDAVSETQN